MNILEVQDLCKTYGKGEAACKRIAPGVLNMGNVSVKKGVDSQNT